MKQLRMRGLPESLRRELREARKARGWSQAELGRQVGLPQVHISRIESGKNVPRFDTLLELVRVLDRDLVMVPRALVPVVNALVRERRDPEGELESLYAGNEEEDA